MVECPVELSLALLIRGKQQVCVGLVMLIPQFQLVVPYMVRRLQTHPVVLHAESLHLVAVIHVLTEIAYLVSHVQVRLDCLYPFSELKVLSLDFCMP